MAYRVIWHTFRYIQYILLDFLVGKTVVTIDCRTLEGKKRFIDLFGIKRFNNLEKRDDNQAGQTLFATGMLFSLDDLQNLFQNLDERGRRLVTAFLSRSLTTREKIRFSEFLHTDPKTINKGIEELITGHHLGKNRVRRNGGGRKPITQKYENFEVILDELVDDHVGGDPMSPKRWVRKSLDYFKKRINDKGISISKTSIHNYFKKKKLTLKSNDKNLSTQQHQDRDLQFQQIKRIRKGFLKSGNPVISIDTKKKEKIGLFKSAGRLWKKVTTKVFDHDFPNLAKCTVIPFGIYDVKLNKGYIYCNTSHETAEFVVDMVVRWWEEKGQYQYPNKDKLLILCDAGGANGYRIHGWKCELQEKVASKLGLQVTVCHYPPGTSKWNPIEHKLFSFISINWAGEPLESIDKMLQFIRSTTTKSGLTVEAYYVETEYKKKKKYSQQMIERLNMRLWGILPEWNYTLNP